MEKVFLNEGIGFSRGHSNHGKSDNVRSGVGVVEKVLEPGRFRVGLDGGVKLEVSGPMTLKPGQLVQVSSDDGRRVLKENPEQEIPRVSKDLVSQWTALIPLGFGGKEARAKLEVRSEGRQGKKGGSVPSASYFVLSVSTKLNGQVQWGVHVCGRQVTLQVHSGGSDRKMLKDLIQKVEGGLRAKGFSLSGPVVILGHPFRKPLDSGLNVKG